MSRMKSNRLAHVGTCPCTGASVLSSAAVLRRRVPPVRAGADGGGSSRGAFCYAAPLLTALRAAGGSEAGNLGAEMPRVVTSR